MNKRVPSNPEQQVCQQILTSQSTHSKPSPPALDFCCSQRSSTCVCLCSVSSYVTSAFQCRCRDSRYQCDNKVKSKADVVLEPKNACYQSREAGSELLSAQTSEARAETGWEVNLPLQLTQ